MIEFGGKPATAVALRDLTHRRHDDARICHLALHDALAAPRAWLHLPGEFIPVAEQANLIEQIGSG